MTYTREQILNMPVGSELDQIAAKLTGYVSLWTQMNLDGTLGYTPRYSTDISAAMELVERLSRGRTDNSFVLEFHYEHYYARFGEVPFRPRRDEVFRTAPEAITKAAILAMMDQSGGQGDE